MLTKNEIQDIEKVISFSEHSRIILLRENARKITSQEGEFLNFRKPLMSVGLSLFNLLEEHLKQVRIFNASSSFS